MTVLDSVAAASDNIWLRWAALLHDIGKPVTKHYDPERGWTFHNHNFVGSKMVNTIFRRMKFPLGQEMRYVSKLVELHMRPIAPCRGRGDRQRRAPSRKLCRGRPRRPHDSARADITVKDEARKSRYLAISTSSSRNSATLMPKTSSATGATLSTAMKSWALRGCLRVPRWDISPQTSNRPSKTARSKTIATQLFSLPD